RYGFGVQPKSDRLLAGVFFAADLAVWHQSIRFTSVTNATLLANLSPLFVTAGSVWLFNKRINQRFLTGLALAVTGSTVLVADSFTVSAQTVWGDCFGVVAAVFYSGYLLSVSRLRQRVSTVEVMWWSTLACAAALLPVVLLLDEPLWPQSGRGWAVLLGLAFVSQITGQGLIAYALALLPASFSSVTLLVQPVAAAVFAWGLLAEPFGVQQALGGAIVLAGNYGVPSDNRKNVSRADAGTLRPAAGHRLLCPARSEIIRILHRPFYEDSVCQAPVVCLGFYKRLIPVVRFAPQEFSTFCRRTAIVQVSLEVSKTIKGGPARWPWRLVSICVLLCLSSFRMPLFGSWPNTQVR
ncbi:MAG: DMT family transporter, partial [Nitrospiraceae bacterium]